MMSDLFDQKGFLGWVISLIILGILTISGITIFLNLPGSLPGDLIYSIKEVSEKLHLAVYDLDYVGKAEVYRELSDNRMDEVRKLIAKREKEDKVIKSLESLVLMQKRAIENIERARSHASNITPGLSKIENSLRKQQSILKELLFEVSSNVYVVIDKTLQSTGDNLESVNSIRGR